MSKSAKGDRQTWNQNQAVDTNTRGQLGDIQNAFQAAGAAGPSPYATGAAQYNQGQMQAGNLGLSALSGNAGAVQQLMNPYTQGVIGTNNDLWQKINQQTQNQVNQNATQAGAFGGTRQGVATGVALAQNNLQQANQNATLLNNQYGQAINQAQGLAGLGFAGSNANAQLGLAGVGDPAQWYAQMLKQGFIMPTGSTSGGATAGTSTSGGFKIPFLGG